MESFSSLPSSRSSSSNAIVAIVGAAGSRQALEMLFRNLPADSGLAFVVAMRLGRQRMNRLPALLAKRTHMPVVVTADATRPQADHIYIVPAGVQGAIIDGELRLTSPAAEGNAKEKFIVCRGRS